MKKLTYFSMLVAALFMVACNGNTKKDTKVISETGTFEEQLIKKGMNMHLDSLTAIWLRLKSSPVYSVTKDGKVKLSDAEKKVQPDYLLNPETMMDKLETLSQKYKALVGFAVDKEFATLYDMKDVYSPAMQKLVADLNDPAIDMIKDNDGKISYEEMNTKVYDMMEENGRGNRYWEMAATGLVEQTYLLCQNKDKFLTNFTDKDAEDIIFRTILLVNAFEDLQEYNPELLNIYNIILPIGKLDAITVDQLSKQLDEYKDEITKVHEQLFE